MKRRDTFQSERAAGTTCSVCSGARADEVLWCQEESDRLSRSSVVCVSCRVGIRIRGARVDMRIQLRCKVGDPDGGVQWLRQYLG